MGLTNESTNQSKILPLENMFEDKALINSEISWEKIHYQQSLAFLKVFSLYSKIPGKLQLLQILLLKF